MSEEKSKRIHRITKDDMVCLLNKSDFEILKKLSRSEFGFFKLLEIRGYTEKHRFAKSDEVQILEIAIKVLNQACSVKGQSHAACLNRLVRMLLSCEEFLYNDVSSVINRCFSENLGINLSAFMAHYMNILTTVLKRDFFPCERIINEIFPALENYMNRLREKKLKNLEYVEACFKELSRKVEIHQSPASSNEEEDYEVSNFRNLSVVPRSNEIVNYEIFNVPQNIIDRPYKSVDHYLSVHYRLTREDMLRSFRECVNKFISNSGQGFSSLDKDRYYEHVTVASPPKYTKEGVTYNVMIKSAREIDWSKKEVLLPGSMVFLTPNSFNSVIFATVKGNPNVSSGKSKECRLSIKLEDDLFVDELKEETVYTMIEPASAYFEMYRHVLSAIKSFNESTFPLSDVISYFDFDDILPQYLTDIQYCLHEECGSIDKHDSKHLCKIFNPLTEDQWPENTSIELDDQQYLAFKAALTKKVTVIQGPPGTGKTHVGKKIVKALLENIPLKPIVICCLTNHALDQFLEGILEKNITRKIVRLGGQSKSEILEPHVLQNFTYSVRLHHKEETLDETQKKCIDLLRSFANKVLETKIFPYYNEEMRSLDSLCQEINATLHSLLLCKDKYLEDAALNDIIVKKYKEMLRYTSGEIKKSLSCSVLEWLACSRKSDLYNKSRKKFTEFEKKQISIPNFIDIWNLSEMDRFELFYLWRKRCSTILKNKLETNLEDYKKRMRCYNYTVIDQVQLEILKGADIIGVTTTGACKYKNLIELAKPSIIIIEEAAQVLESHVIASLVPSMQHMILVGDHEQLRPLPANHELSEMYNLKISMFERLFRNGAPSVTLISQHRMKPCIAELLVPKPYEHYTSADEVYKYEEIKGVQSSVYFFSHDHSEDNSCGMSSSNDFEARMIASLAKYFVAQSYLSKQITVLATYASQVLLILKYLSEKKIEGIYVTTVDNFQGEENDIILLSFVRSNSTTIGFLKESNRICVALSRAKKGLFCFGNFELFARKNEFWKAIVDKARSKSMLVDTLCLKCERHQNIRSANCEEDILGFLNSGCSEICNYILRCKHKCSHSCHFNDPEHLNYFCQQPCEKLMDNNQICPRRCYQKCKRVKKNKIELNCGHLGYASNPLCLVEVPRVLPCRHVITVECHIDTQKYKCNASVKKVLECGHLKMISCHEQQENINIICTQPRPETGSCGHIVYVPCYLHWDENYKSCCNKACGALLECGHPCNQFCQECSNLDIHGYCIENCEFILSCGHRCMGSCNSPCPPCEQSCFVSCIHGTQCINKCLRPCVTCEKPCGRFCKHQQCSKKCSQKCDVDPCMQPCSEVLSCGHRCIGFCGDPCPYLCRVCHFTDLKTGDAMKSLYIELECEHVIESNELAEHIENCLISFQWPCCPVCLKVINRNLRFKDSLLKAKEICINSYDTTEIMSDIQYLVDSMYGIHRIVPSQFQDIDDKIQNILKRKNPRMDSLLVLKNCMMLLKKLVNKQNLLQSYNTRVQETYEMLLLWIKHHLTKASFQQLKKLEMSVRELKDSMEQKKMKHL